MDSLQLPLVAVGMSLSTGLCAAAAIMVLSDKGGGGGGGGRPDDEGYDQSGRGGDPGFAGEGRARRRGRPSAGSPRAARQKALDEVNDLVLNDDVGIRAGFSMEDAMAHSAEIAATFKAKTPTQVLNDLQRGNTRFWMGAANRPEVSAFERRALIMKQHPCVAILGCSDSRVPIEIVFDQGLGDIFVIRVAGNCLDTATIGSLEYAALHLHVKCLVVMGHEGCGAVKAARSALADIDKEPACLGHLLRSLKDGLHEERLTQINDHRACDREAVVTNVKVQVEALLMNGVVKSQVEKGELLVVGAFYEMSSGIVDFYRSDETNTMCGQCVDGVNPGSPSRRTTAAARKKIVEGRKEGGGGLGRQLFPMPTMGTIPGSPSQAPATSSGALVKNLQL